jgi:hypothetical protein
MVHSWLEGRMTDEHRRDLSVLSRGTQRVTGDQDPVHVAAALDAPSLQPQQHGSKPGTPAPRHPLAPHVGSLLIRVGTRLGGASVRTS